MANQKFFVARYLEESGEFTVIEPKTGERANLRQEQLSGIVLGDFFKIIDKKAKKTSFLRTTVDGDFAYVGNIRAKLLVKEDVRVFESILFSDALCNDSTLPLGDYEVKIRLLPSVRKLPSGELIHFEVVHALFGFDSPLSLQNTPPRPVTFSPIQPIPSPVPRGSVDLMNLSSPASPIPSNSSFGSRSSTPVGTSQIVKGDGFQPKPKPKNKNKNNKNAQIFGSGFAPAVKKVEGVIEGSGFPSQLKNVKTFKAVVLSMSENTPKNMNTHYLWILNNQSEGRFVSNKHKLAPGHFFEGQFKETKNKKWKCESYEKQIEKPLGIDGGMDEYDKIWFSVTVNKFQPAGGNRRFANVTAKYFGEVLEGELDSTKLTEQCNGKKVKIQRKGIAEKDYVWMVIEIL